MNLKCLPYNVRGTVAIGSVAAVNITPGVRAQLPLPPGKVQVNGNYWPNGATYSGAADVTLTWAHRLRTAGRAVIQQDAASVAGGPEGTYTVDVYVNGVKVRTFANLTGTSQVYTFAQRTADNADLSKPVRFRITPVNGTLTGPARDTDNFYMSL